MEIFLLQVQSVVLALDADESGQKAASKLAGERQAAGGRPGHDILCEATGWVWEGLE